LSKTNDDVPQTEEGRADVTEVGAYFSLLSRVGLVMAFSLLFFFFIGMKLDSFVGTFPLFTIIGVLLGVAGGFYNVYRAIMEVGKKR
jgi:ATP synthase protein I